MINQFTSCEQLAEYRQWLRAEHDPNRTCVTVCGGTGCRANVSLDVAAAFRQALQENGDPRKIDLRVTGCLGFCEKGPIVTIRPQGLIYTKVTPADVAEIVQKTLIRGEEIGRLFVKDPQTGKPVRTREEIPFYRNQTPVLFGANFELDPTSIDDYIRIGGYTALVKALTTMVPEEIVEEVTRSGLRGRGGAGFPTGAKWASCRKAEGDLEVRDLQRRRGGPRCVCQPQPHGRQPAQRHRGHDHRRLCHWGPRGLRVREDRVSPGRGVDAQSDCRRTEQGTSRRQHPRHGPQLRRLDQPGRGRVCLRRIDGA